MTEALTAQDRPTPAEADGLLAVRDLERRIRDRLDELDATGELMTRARAQAAAHLDLARRQTDAECAHLREQLLRTAREDAARRAAHMALRTERLVRVSAERRALDVADVVATVVATDVTGEEE